ncbi:MAG: methylenetetrahydrofolate reductase C-terminal domain-containing protein [Armatimonadota bacterium]
MIITKFKDFKVIEDNLKDYNNIAIVGCGRCATSCQTGGEDQVAQMKEKLEGMGKKIVYYKVLEVPCDERIVKKEFAKVNLDKVDCILTMCCGSGTSSVSDLIDKRVIPALDSLFLGVIKRLGDYDERCSMCGECVLDKTCGICPVTRCAKGLLNGPCGGSVDGKCEVNSDRDCAWAMIYEALKKAGKLENINEYWGPKNYHSSIKPQALKAKRDKG